jgi:hypothetical protein
MKITKIINWTGFISAVLLSATAQAYSPDLLEDMCKKPHFRDFSLPTYAAPENKEVPPESEFTIMLSPWTDPKTIKLTAKNEPIKFTIESNDSFHRITAKVPPAFTGKYVRLNLTAKAVLGCSEKEGWLLKVTDSKPVAAAVEPVKPEAQVVAEPVKTEAPEAPVLVEGQAAQSEPAKSTAEVETTPVAPATK